MIELASTVGSQRRLRFMARYLAIRERAVKWEREAALPTSRKLQEISCLIHQAHLDLPGSNETHDYRWCRFGRNLGCRPGSGGIYFHLRKRRIVSDERSESMRQLSHHAGTIRRLDQVESSQRSD